ncbi:MAG: GreA/GreB family elongation factor [Flavobacterium sp.]
MSRGFVREDDQEELPIVPPRADLPDGQINYVTQAGLDQLIEERELLTLERENLDKTNEADYRIGVNYINAKLLLLNGRISSAHLIKLENQHPDEVRFGAIVTLTINGGKQKQKFQIVGVDEADIKKMKIAFTSPLAKILIEKKVGDKAVLKLEKEDRVFEIVSISY